jgi:four helix bundle protein
MEEQRKAKNKGQRTKAADPLMKYIAYTKALEFYDRVIEDTDLLMSDIRAREIARQIVRSSASISANFEEGYGRGSTKEFVHHLRISRGEARETKGWYRRARRFLPAELVTRRMEEADEIIALLVSTIKPLEEKIKVEQRKR